MIIHSIVIYLFSLFIVIGGDCCQTKADKEGAKFKFCTKCLCLDEKQAPKCQKNGSCGNRKYANDGRCDDANNNCGCNWDGDVHMPHVKPTAS